MDSIPDDLLELQARFDQWRANRKYNREPIPDELRDAALEMSRRYPPSLLRRVLKIQRCRKDAFFPRAVALRGIPLLTELICERHSALDGATATIRDFSIRFAAMSNETRWKAEPSL